MKYEFPIIKRIEDILPAIKDKKEFIVAERESYTVINYTVAFSETFDLDDDKVDNYGTEIPAAWIRRECRGIIFDKNGDLISRPYAKFFNVNEKPETKINNLNVSLPHIVLDKLDGSFIRPFRTSDGVFRVGTKMGETEVAEYAKPFFDKQNYKEFADWCIDKNLTPIFEFMSRKQRIVVDYGDTDRLVLLAIRENYSGNYIQYR